MFVIRILRKKLDTIGDFYHQFESGSLGDPIDFLEWSGLYELHQKAQRKTLSIGLAA